MNKLDDLLCRLLWGQLQLMGLFTEKNLGLADFKTKIGLRDSYERWLEESIAVLAQKNYLQYDGETCTLIDTLPVDIGALWEEWDREKNTWLEDPDLKARVVLLEATLRVLPEILTGKRLATDIMFPNSSMELVEGIYKNNLVADYFNEVLANTVVAYIKERLQQDPAARIRIIEIGAGTGGTSITVFQKIKPYQEHIQEYCYTDISKAFLMLAEKEFGLDNSYLTYKMFNVEVPITGQGISAGGYDLVIAANVLHATKNIRQTLRNTKAVLKNGGLILLNELSCNSLFAHLTFGLLEGWWLYEDSALRLQGCPGISPETWQVVLESEGFRSIFFPAQEAHDLGQQIVVAESDGVVKQKQFKPGVAPMEKTIKTKGNNQSQQNHKLPNQSVTPDKQRVGQKTQGIQTGVNLTDQMVEEHVKATIIERLSESLKVDINMIDVNESFADYGLDSITGVRLVRVVNQTLMTELETTSLFDYSSVKELTKHILSKYRDIIATNLEQNVKRTARDTYDDQEKQPVYSSIKRFLRKREFAKPLIKRIEKCSKNPIQKDSIAIIGMSGRFAKSKTVNELWKHLSNGIDLVQEVKRWDLSEYYNDSSQEAKNYCNYGSFIDNIDKFDPLFFNISGLEATYMDPQQRLFLEESWKALEDAGYAGSGVEGHLCGVYAGFNGGDYAKLIGDSPPAQSLWGNISNAIPARIAYYLNLQGPAIAVDTACSGSLVAIHLACQGLWTRETEMALAGGVYVQCTPGFYFVANRSGMLSSTGCCHTFDERADGFVPGEGVGVVVLKRLQEAIADGDHIYGVIRGSGVNQDGTTNGITSPSANSQERLECHVYDTFNINPEQIQMAEAHGTGTKLGDPIEFGALTRAFRKYTDKKGYCAIGSIKTNIGHTTAASGVAGVIKILLSLQHKKIPPTLHFQSGNSHIRFEDSPFYVNTNLRNWDIEPNSKRCAVVSSFGLSGTNAHMVIEEAPMVERQHSEKLGNLIVLSARTSEQLRQQVEQLLEYCTEEHQVDCGNISFTLLLGRRHFNHRLACIVHSQDELIQYLKKWLAKGKISQIYVSVLRENDQREQPSLKQYGNQCIQNCQNTSNVSDYLDYMAVIAELYSQGYELEFEQLFANEQYSRISLPTYPFAKDSYWVPEDIVVSGGSAAARSEFGASTHPRLQQDTADLAEPGSVSDLAILGTMLLQPCWKEQAIAMEAIVSDYQQHLVMLCELGKVSKESIESQMYGVRCLSMQSEQKGVAERFQSYAVQSFEEIQNIIKEKPSGKVLIQIVVSTQTEQQLFSGLSGLLKTAQLENPKLIGQLIEVGPGDDSVDIIEKLKENSRSPLDNHICYQAGKRCIAGWSQVEAFQETAGIPWKDQGVYLITGGLGGLGLIFAREITHKVKDVTLILIGRSELSEDQQAIISDLRSLGARIIYRQVNVTQAKEVADLFHSIQENFERINGIIHCAGVIRDNFILRKTKEELLEVLAPKVKGLVNLDLSSKNTNLDFFILFSSGAGAIGNPGQADYCAANAFMDTYARYRNALVASNQRQGQTLSINWPLWKEGGMHVHEENKKMMMQKMGITSMATPTGIWALYQALAVGNDQVMVMEGNLLKMQEHWLGIPVKGYAHSDKVSISRLDSELLLEKTLLQIKVQFGEVTKLVVGKIDAEEPLESYGIDSIMITQLNQKLAGIFGELSKTLFYEYQTLRALAEYLIAEYPKECMKWTGLTERVQSKPAVISQVSPFDGQFPVRIPIKAGETSTRSEDRESIAIIGMSGRYPKAKNLNDYWENLQAGKDCITEIPEERWSMEGFFHPHPQEAVAEGKSYSKWGGFVDGFADFDPLFFNISPREALNMDPQERWFIESCWELFEDAGYSKEQIANQCNRRIGVFAGITKTGFALYGPDLWKQGEEAFPHTSFSSVANRISYLMNLQGPSMAIDTMCSSSLTAIHEACEHLHRRECEMAVAGGVNLYVHPSTYIGLCTQQMLSVDGQCKSFGQGGNGFVPGEGVGVVLLKPLSQAVADQDHIYAIIKGTSINHGGKTNGYTVPNPTAQGELVRVALDKAGAHSREISYIEAHGTGTELGDPIEITGLIQAFRKDTQDTGFCAIGSVKSNIGHLEAAAGIAGVTKVILQMMHQKIVPSLHAEELNPNINFAKTPFVVQRELAEWKRPMVEINGKVRECPRIAGISAFGAGGSNAHIIIEEYISKAQEQPTIVTDSQNPAIVVLSAKNEEGLKEQVKQLLAEIGKAQFADTSLADIAYTLQVGREAMEERLAVIVGSIKELEGKLKSFVEGRQDIQDMYSGQVKSNKETLAIFTADEELQEAVNQWIQRRKYSKLLDLWVKGLNFDWNKLYGDNKPRRISLPTYPFARKRYWITPRNKRDAQGSGQEWAKELHPPERCIGKVNENSDNEVLALFRRLADDDDLQVDEVKVILGVI